jgi:Sensors of blue-light using FAD
VADQPGSRQDCDLLRLVFVSRARPGLTPEDLESLSRRSEARNRAAGLTGLLLHQGETFFCVLEGARRRLFAAMERIITDPRHAGVEILLEMPIENRRFDSWSLGRLPDGALAPCSADFVRALGCRQK